MPATPSPTGLPDDSRSPSPTVTQDVRDGVLVITLSNPPVNGLGLDTRRGLSDAISTAASDAAVEAVVIVGDGGGFCAGADLRQLGTPDASAEPSLTQVVQQVMDLTKPVVAAIHGFALGGGYELALACSHRVAHVDARIGLPEVAVGLVPGAGGTQRLPRLVGARAALELIQAGTAVRAGRALELSMVDAVTDGDVLQAALALVEAERGAGLRPRLDDRPPAEDIDVDFAAARREVGSRARNRLARLAAVDCVEAATRLTVEEGLALERTHFTRLADGPESAALRHVFLAERLAARATDIDRAERPRPLERVAVIGAGTMGRGIAMALADGGLMVDLVEQDPQALERGVDAIRGSYESALGKGRLDEGEVHQRLARINPTLDLGQASAADLVIEAVFEDMSVKRDVLAHLDAVMRPGAVLATNTSRLDIDELARSVSRPADLIGLHFFSPANVMRLLEVVRGAATADDVVVTGLALAQRIGKTPVLSRVCEGFIGNRMLTPYRREADFLLEEGGTPEQIDRALESFGLAMGPFRMSDLAGLDIGWAARRRLAPTRDLSLRYSRVADVLCEAGRFGQKSGRGYYLYEKGSRQPIVDPDVERIARECAEQDGVATRNLSDGEIVDRCVLALVNEGARVLADGIAQRASDIDVVYVNGYGFPATKGGPMHHAETIGLDEVLRRTRAFERFHGAPWKPAPLLEQLVADGRTTFD